MLLGQRNSTDLPAKEFIGAAGGKLRVVSVDGDNTAKGAMLDFWLAQNIVDPRSVVVADYSTIPGLSASWKRYLADFVVAYNFGRRLKTLKGLAPYEFICKRWTIEPENFNLNPLQQMPGLNI